MSLRHGRWTVTKKDRRVGQLVPQANSECPLVRICHNDEIHFRTGQPFLSNTVHSRRLSFFGHLHRTDPSQDHYRALQACSMGPPDDWRRTVGRPRQSWLWTVEAKLRPMNLGLATSKRRAQVRSILRKLIATATSTTTSWKVSMQNTEFEFHWDRYEVVQKISRKSREKNQ